LPALAKLKAEGGTKNFARNLRDALLGSEPRVLTGGVPEWLEAALTAWRELTAE
jgi:hypothetical protein